MGGEGIGPEVQSTRPSQVKSIRAGGDQSTDAQALGFNQGVRARPSLAWSTRPPPARIGVQ